jgi:ribosomal protein S18 acetylase RimI-like enzyme
MIRIRPASPADETTLGRHGALLVDMHHGLDPERFIPAGPDTARAYGRFLTSHLGREDVVVLVAEEAGNCLGYTYAGVEGTDYMALRGAAGVIYDLIVDPARRREGIGRRLLDATLAALLERGAPRVVLSTAARNAAAQSLFRKIGFRRTMVEMTWEPHGKE